MKEMLTAIEYIATWFEVLLYKIFRSNEAIHPGDEQSLKDYNDNKL
jgi:hypothetical protein